MPIDVERLSRAVQWELAMGIEDLLHRSARAYRDRPALYRGGDRVATYGEFAAASEALAGALSHDLALSVGDRVALFMTNAAEYPIALFAIWSAGLVAVPINAKLHPDELDFILDDSGAKLVFVTPDLARTANAARRLQTGVTAAVETGGREWHQLLRKPPVDRRRSAPGDLAWLFYTSGTTGRPKGAMLTHANLLAMVAAFFQSVDAPSPLDCFYHAAPMSHGSGLYILPHVMAGAANVAPESSGFTADELADMLGRHRGIGLFAAPTMVRRLLRHPRLLEADRRNLRTLIYGGGPMFVRDRMEAQAVFGDSLVQIYGLGETPMTGTVLTRYHHADRTHPRAMERLASIGIPQAGVGLRILDELGVALPPGETGQIALMSPTVMAGYWQRPDATAATVVDGWLLTGDLGLQDADGFVTLKGRDKDVIISGGTNIYPKEVEDVLLSHPDVGEAAVVGAIDAEWGELVVAFIVPREAKVLSLAELDLHCRRSMAGFKRPRRYAFVQNLPKNPYGKVLKSALRVQLAEDGTVIQLAVGG